MQGGTSSTRDHSGPRWRSFALLLVTLGCSSVYASIGPGDRIEIWTLGALLIASIWLGAHVFLRQMGRRAKITLTLLSLYAGGLALFLGLKLSG